MKPVGQESMNLDTVEQLRVGRDQAWVQLPSLLKRRSAHTSNGCCCYDVGPLLFYLYKCPRVTETPENHIFCFKKSIDPLYGMCVVWYEAWFTLILQLSIIYNFKCVPE